MSKRFKYAGGIWDEHKGRCLQPSEIIDLLNDEVTVFRQSGVEADVHTEHCCLIHGCKYGDPECSVTTGLKRQSFPCEECEIEIR
jgi:hypothetical protein